MCEKDLDAQCHLFLLCRVSCQVVDPRRATTRCIARVLDKRPNHQQHHEHQHKNDGVFDGTAAALGSGSVVVSFFKEEKGKRQQDKAQHADGGIQHIVEDQHAIGIGGSQAGVALKSSCRVDIEGHDKHVEGQQ